MLLLYYQDISHLELNEQIELVICTRFKNQFYTQDIHGFNECEEINEKPYEV